MMRMLMAFAACAAAALGAAFAQDEAAPPLLPRDVAASAAAHYPQVVAALAERRGAAGELLAARGAFDTVFSAEGQSRLAGYYDGQYAKAEVSRALGPMGARVYGGYRISEGDFPTYEDYYYTDQAGELSLGILFSLLRDRAIDENRFGVRDARLALREADLEVLLTRVGVQQQALLAYWRWVAAGRQLEVYEDLLRLAQTRTEGLEAEVERGARAAIYLTENAQTVTRRRVLVEQARRDFRLAANALSLYLRGPLGEPAVPAPSRLPAPEAVELPTLADAALPAILARRPELALLRTAAERARGRVALAENTLKPRLDVGVSAAKDIGPVAEGGPSRNDAEAILGVEFEIPLGRRAARGELAAARAEVRALEAERRLAQDRIGIELREIVLELEAAENLLRLARQEVEQAERIRQAEQRRFEEGASDFFLINLREEALADARTRYARSLYALASARATYDAAVLDLDRLGLNEVEAQDGLTSIE